MIDQTASEAPGVNIAQNKLFTLYYYFTRTMLVRARSHSPDLSSAFVQLVVAIPVELNVLQTLDCSFDL